MDKKKAEVGRRRRFLGKMEKKFRGKLLLLGCLLLAIIPSIVYADYYSQLKLETHPVMGSTDVIKGFPFEIKVIACNEDEDPITSDTSGWNYARSADIILSCDEPDAWIKNDSGNWVSLSASRYSTLLGGNGDKIFDVILGAVGDDKTITVEQDTGEMFNVKGDYLDFKVYDFVDQFRIDAPIAPQTAGVEFDITVVAEDSNFATVEPFKGEVNISAVIPPMDTYEPDMIPARISFINGVSTPKVTIYGSHPESRFVKIKCKFEKQLPIHGTIYAEGNRVVSVYPHSYAKILLLVPGEELQYGKVAVTGKQGIPSPQTAGGLINPKVKVYTTDAYWNPLPANVSMTFSSSDSAATFDGPVGTTFDHAQVFDVTLYTTNTNPGHSIMVSDSTRDSVSTGIIVNPNTADYFEFDGLIGDTQYTTEPIQINVIAYDEDDNVATDYNVSAQLECSIGDDYITPNTIQFSDGRASALVHVTKRGNDVKIKVTDGSNSVISNLFNVYAGPFSELLVLFEGENHTAGLEDGKNLTPNPITAGDSMTATVIACDGYWNRINTSVNINVECPTGYIEPVPEFALVNGSGQCQVTFRTAKTPSGVNKPQYITVSSGGTTGTSSPIQVNSGLLTYLVLVAPGEDLDPGTSNAFYGKSGSATTQAAGVSFDLTVAATDRYWNPVDEEFSRWIDFWSTDEHQDVCFAGEAEWTNIKMEGRIKTFADNKLITRSSNGHSVFVTVSALNTGRALIPVTHGPLARFEFGQIPSLVTAGESIDVTITAKDQYDNTVESFEKHYYSIYLESDRESSLFTISPMYISSLQPFENGVYTFPLKVYKADNDIRITARGYLRSSDPGVSTSGWYEGTSNPFNVKPGNYAGLILLLPPQIHRPGDIVRQGRDGVADAYTVGDPAVETIVYAVDQYWNRVNPPDPEPRIRLTTGRYMDVGPANPRSMGNGEVTFWTSFRTAGNWQWLTAEDTDPGRDYKNTTFINVNPGNFAKLQIIAPGENPDPGSAPDGNGKTGSPLAQVAGVSFDLAVRAVDNYWNLVPTINSESIDLISLTDIGLDNRYPLQPFEAGVSTFTIWLNGNNEEIDVTAIKQLTPPFLVSDTVMIFVETGYSYEIVVPTYCTAGNLSRNTFTMIVRLVDDNDDVVTEANNDFQMTPCLAVDYSPATNPDGLGRKEYSLVSGERTFEQSYDIVEEICIKVTDVFGREQYSDAIDVRETALEYKVDVPAQATAGEEFQMTVSLLDRGTGNVVPTRDNRAFNLAPVSGAEPGRLYVNSGVLSRGTLTITNQWYTKAECIQIGASDAEIYDPPAGDGWSDSFQILPGTLERLQILAPVEIHRPGEWAYVSTGKDSSGLLVQDTEIEFPVTVRAVDQYWNLVDFDGGSVYLSSDNSFSSQAELPLDNGMATFQVTIHQSGSSFTLKAEAKQPTDLQPQRVTIPMEVAEYRITSAISNANTVTSFQLTIELLDSAGLPKQGANNSFILTPYTVNYEDAPGKLTVTPESPALENGYAQVSVNYDTAGKIRIKVSDSFGRPEAYTELIDIQPVGLRYEVVAPEKVEAGKEFTVTVKLIDTGAGNVVTLEKYDRQVKLDAYYPDETPAEGKLKVETFYLEGGEKTILQSYNLAEDIYIEAIEASDASTSPSATSDRTGNIEVYGAPKTVMELEGVYNEMNGAIYLRGSTLVKILCVSEIEAETILYRDNGAGWRTYEEPFGLSPGGHTIEYYGIDKYGHEEEINKSRTIYVSFFSDGVDGVSNRPNPFRAGREETLIEYNLKQPSNVIITIYDLFGQEVWHESYAAGEDGGSTANTVRWDGRNLSGKVVANGGYICRIWVDREKKHMVRKIGVAK